MIKRLTYCAVFLTLAISGCRGGDGGTTTPSGQSGTSNTPGPTNAPPTIGGQPGGSVLVSNSYSFQPTANDANGDALTFQASNLPEWASFDTATGRISGQPTAADIGTYAGITITVSDGTTTVSLPAFSISVTDTGSGSATLSWVPPTQNSDGTALTNLAGYEIRYGVAQSDLSKTIAVSNPSLSTYMVENLTSGTWYFAVVAITSTGSVSDLSNIASKTIG